MHAPLIVIFCWALTAVFSYPIKHDVVQDVQVLAFADVLEQLESAFYTQALQKFNSSSFLAAGFASPQVPIQQIRAIASDEGTHLVTLQSAISALSGQVVSNCTFNFSSALTNVNTMVATARVVENVGVSAYLGALTALTDPALVTAAGSILTVEARHQSILNLLSNATSIPQPFDIALTPADVLAIAGSFISGCKLSFSANPPLTVTNNGPLQAGTRLNFSSPALNGTTSTTQLSCEIVTGDSSVPLFQPADSCTVPANVTGPMYVFITDNQTAVNSSSNTNSTTNSTTAAIVAGPALLFVNQPDFIGNLIRPGLSAVGATTGDNTTASALPTATMASTSLPPVASSTSPVTALALPTPGTFTTTLSPEQASTLLASLGS